MDSVVSRLEIESLVEGTELEVKLAVGRDGRGELPKSFLESYSAMANTSGGVILLGIEEEPIGFFRVRGIVDVARVIASL